jgi:hypothetical protein
MGGSLRNGGGNEKGSLAALDFKACAARGEHRINLLGVLRQAIDALAIDRKDAIPGA